MFKHVSIRLTSPLCTCKTQSVNWGITKESSGKAGLSLSCKLCGTRLLIPHNKFVARFEFDEEYPEGTGREEEEKERLTVLDGGKVLDFPSAEEPSSGDEDEDVS